MESDLETLEPLLILKNVKNNVRLYFIFLIIIYLYFETKYFNRMPQ